MAKQLSTTDTFGKTIDTARADGTTAAKHNTAERRSTLGRLFYSKSMRQWSWAIRFELAGDMVTRDLGQNVTFAPVEQFGV